MMAGTTLIDTIMFKQFWKQYSISPTNATVILQATAKVAVLFAVGFLLLLLSGVTIMLLTNGIYGEQLWFKIKMMLVIAAILNGLLLGRRTGLQIRRSVAGEDTGRLQALKKRLTLFHISQLTILTAIFVMGVFKFN